MDISKGKKKLKNNHSNLNDKAKEYLYGWQRTQADFENYKKQTDKRIRDVIEYGNTELLLELLPLYNHFKSALIHVPEEQRESAWYQGLGHIKKLWEDLFIKFNIEEIKTVGENFNHNLHEAIEFEELADKRDGEIIKEIQSGYKLNGKVIQAAKVIVNKFQDGQNKKNINKIKKNKSSHINSDKSEFDI